MKKYAARPALSRVLCDYLLYHDHNPKKALELCAHATKFCEFKDWWWKARLGKCYYQLGLYRDAEKQFKSSLKEHGGNMIVTHLELAKVYLKMDQPLKALEVYKNAAEQHPGDTILRLNIARVYDMLNMPRRHVNTTNKSFILTRLTLRPLLAWRLIIFTRTNQKLLFDFTDAWCRWGEQC